MTRDNIISELFRSKDFNDCIKKMEPRHLQDDLRSEVMLALCEKEPFVIEALHERGELKYYAVKIILNLIRSNTSPFYKKFRQHTVDVFSNSGSAIDFCNEEGEGARFNINDPKSYLKRMDVVLDDEAVRTINFNDRLTEEKKNELRMMEVFNLFWYDKEMILLYLEHGNYRAIQDETNIEHTSVFKTIKRAITKIDAAVEIRMLKPRPYEPCELIEYITRSDRRQAIDYLKNVLHYFQKEYAGISSEILRRANEREQRFIDQELKVNIA